MANGKEAIATSRMFADAGKVLTAMAVGILRAVKAAGNDTPAYPVEAVLGPPAKGGEGFVTPDGTFKPGAPFSLYVPDRTGGRLIAVINPVSAQTVGAAGEALILALHTATATIKGGDLRTVLAESADSWGVAAKSSKARRYSIADTATATALIAAAREAGSKAGVAYPADAIKAAVQDAKPATESRIRFTDAECGFTILASPKNANGRLFVPPVCPTCNKVYAPAVKVGGLKKADLAAKVLALQDALEMAQRRLDAIGATSPSLGAALPEGTERAAAIVENAAAIDRAS